MIYQLIDTKHLRMGFKGSANGRWSVQGTGRVGREGSEIGKIDETCLGIVTGRYFHLSAGAPMYMQYKIDYIRFRRGVT